MHIMNPPGICCYLMCVIIWPMLNGHYLQNF